MGFNLSSSLSRIFAASAFALVMAGCSTLPQGDKPENDKSAQDNKPAGNKFADCMEVDKKSLIFIFQSSKGAFSKDCALHDTANHYSQSSDEGERLMAQIIRESNDKRVKDAGDKVRDLAVPKDVECDVKVWKKVNGKIYIPLSACQKPVVAPEAGASAPAATASAPAP